MNLEKVINTRQIFDVTGGEGGKAYLLVGQDATALIDTGMAYCAGKLAENCRQQLGERPLDTIIISHSHYDHIGAIPFLRETWPAVQVLGAAYAKRVLIRPNAQKTIRQLSEQAALELGGQPLLPYDPTMFVVDQVIDDGDGIDLGGMTIRVIATPGHTQCSLSFLVNHAVLFASESTGCMLRSGKVHPAFVTSAADALKSVEICRKLDAQHIISPHYGWVDDIYVPSYWQNCASAIRLTQDFILDSARKGHSEEGILKRYEAAFWDDDLARVQPLAAFRLNTASMIQTVLRENRESISRAE